MTVRASRAAPVIVVGAGAAGLMAARTLADEGIDVLILEASDRIGGRIHTRREDQAAPVLELGAELIHGRPRATWDLIREMGLLAYDVPFEHWRVRAGRLSKISNYAEELSRTMRGLSRLRHDMTFAEYLARGLRDEESTASRSAALDFVRGFDAADPQRISAKSLAREQEGLGDVGGEMQFRLLEGYGGLLNGLRSLIPRGRCTIRFGSPVSEVHWTNQGVELTVTKPSGRRTRLRAERVIITLPLAILKLPPTSAHGVRFAPDIPEKRVAMTHLASGAVVKVILLFDAPLWEEPAIARAAGADETFRDLGFMHGPGLPIPTWWTARPLRLPLLTGWAGGPDADALHGKSEEELTRAGIESLARLLHRRASAIRDRVRRAVAVDWGAEPWARGAYSYECVGGAQARRTLAEPLLGRLFFAGEATDTEGQSSSVAGALASGARAAREVIEARGPSRRASKRRARKSQ